MDGKLTSREKFIKVYANLPVKVREEIIYVTEDQKPITWNVAYIEVQNNTKLAEALLRDLERLQII